MHKLLNCNIRPHQTSSLLHWVNCLGLLLTFQLITISPKADAADPGAQDLFDEVSKEYSRQTHAILRKYCMECHSTASPEGELDLERFSDVGHVRQHPEVWIKVLEMIDNGEMPPKDAEQPTVDERRILRDWVNRYLYTEAIASAGDPGPVVLRRLNNAEYTYSIQDLTGVPLYPAREFPVDSAAGEGFTNTGNSLVMSPAMVTKYLDAGKEISRHMVLLPNGLRFSAKQTRNDWTNDVLDQIRSFYGRYSEQGGGDQVNLQGIVFATNDGGRLPLQKYIEATLDEREALRSGQQSIAQVAEKRGLSAKYLGSLWTMLTADDGDSLLLDQVRSHWRAASPGDSPKLVAEIARWQNGLWRFTTVGHIGKKDGPKAWMEPVSPIASRQDLRLPLQVAAGEPLRLYLSTTDAGDGNDDDYVIWERPRFVAPGRPDILLKDLGALAAALREHRQQLIDQSEACLLAAAEASSATADLDMEQLAAKYKVDVDALRAWFDYLGVGTAGPARIGPLVSRKVEGMAGYDFIKGWVGDDALSLVANSSDQHVRIPGNMKPHSVAVHPSPTIAIGVAWRSPVTATLTIEGAVQHAHPECGNGVAWALELRRGNTKQNLAAGISHGASVVPVVPEPGLSVKSGDVIAIVVSPRDGNHSCDLTAIDLTIKSAEQEWSIAGDLSSDVTAGNPHADRFGNTDVWHFFSEPASGSAGHVIPAGSILARWQAEPSNDVRSRLSLQLKTLLHSGGEGLTAGSPDEALYRQLTSLNGPLLSTAINAIAADPARYQNSASTEFGLPISSFGTHPELGAIEAASLCVQAPAVIEIPLPADLIAGSEFVSGVSLHPTAGRNGSAQANASLNAPQGSAGLQAAGIEEKQGSGPWTSNLRSVQFTAPILVQDGSEARQRIEKELDDFRMLFPASLCYTKIVPVDEVVTLTLFYREDDHLKRLMLTEDESRELDRLWDEMHYVSRDAFALVDAYQQLMEFATQDADPSVFEPLREPIHRRAEDFRKILLASEPGHVEALVRFADQAYRRPLSEAEAGEIRSLYAELRKLELPHEEAISTLLARILVSPAFLYRLETPGDGVKASPVSDWELASRLSYFLWCSQPDGELRRAAASGELSTPDGLREQVRRMMQDPKVRRMSNEFACQWLHIYDFDQLDEKSESHFPTFRDVRQPMYEEAILFFTDLIQRDGNVLEVFDADHTFLNEPLAKHYGIPDVLGTEWRRVEGVRKYSRGGILGLGATLSKQSGASRTSPILRGNWLSEVILGEKLPKPPKGVPPLPEDEAAETLTVRELVERHTQDERCSGCHKRIDPYGFVFEGFDAIGRTRTEDLGGRPIQTSATVLDGTKLSNIEELRSYLVNVRREAIIHQFCRKLLGFSLGRAVQLSDEPLLREMQTKLQENDYRISVLIDSIVQSPQFREIRGRDYLADSHE